MNSQPIRSPNREPRFNRVLSRLQSWTHRLAVLACLMLAVGIPIRLTVGDAFLITAVPYYVTPPAAMVLLAFFAAIFIRPIRHARRKRFLLVLIGLVGVGWTWNSQTCHNAATTSDESTATLRIMVWNVYEGKFGWPDIVAIMQEENPDIIAIAEAGPVRDPGRGFFKQHFPAYEMETIPRQLVILSKFPIQKMDRILWDTNGVYEAVHLTTPAGPLAVLFADVKSAPWIHRSHPMQSLAQSARSIDGPVIAVGDWNTPVDSVLLSDFRKDFVNAFEVSGNGLHTTWPMPLPVLAIDHIWGRDVHFLNTRIRRTLQSDHCPIVADFEMY